METIFRTSEWANSEPIEELELVKSTDKTVTVIETGRDGSRNEVRNNWSSSYSKYWKTKAEAREYLISKYTTMLRSLEAKQEEYKRKLDDILNIEV